MAYIAAAIVVWAAAWAAESLNAPGVVFVLIGLAFFVALGVIAEVFSRHEW